MFFKLDSVKKKINLLNFLLYVIAITAIVFLVSYKVKGIITKDFERDFNERLRHIKIRIDDTYKDWQDYGSLDTLESRYQERVIGKLKRTFYKNKAKNLNYYFFITDSTGVVVLHPNMKKGSKEAVNKDFMSKIVNNNRGMFDYIWRGQEKWMTFDTVPHWNWKIAYCVTNSYKYKELEKFYIFFIILMVAYFTAVLLLGYILLSKMVNPLKEITEISESIANGDLRQKIFIKRNDEIGALANSFRVMIRSLQEKANILQRISDGELNTKVEVKSKKDVLGKSLKLMVRVLQAITDKSNQISRGNFDIKLKTRSKKDLLIHSLNSMAETLKANKVNLERERWLKNGIAKVEGIVREERDLKKFANDVLKEICNYTNSKIGTFYVSDYENADNDHFHLKASYSLKNNERVREMFVVGEGIQGQVVKNNNYIILDSVPSDYVEIQSGLGATLPKSICITPLAYEDSVIGVIEIAGLNKYNSLKLDFIKEISDVIAIKLKMLIDNLKLEKSLNTAKRQRYQLETQQEELKASNEEMIKKTRALENSEEKLREQQEELQQSNQELEEQTEKLELQQEELNTQYNKALRSREEAERKTQKLKMASKYKSEFLANMSHELRTPLNSILLMSQMLTENRRGNLDKRQVSFASTINSSGNELLNLINEILDLSKIEAGQTTIHFEKVEIKPLCNRISKYFDEFARKKKIDFQIDIKPEVENSIITDKQRIEQVIKNLLSNAFKFTDEGYIYITIRNSVNNEDYELRKLDPENFVEFIVEDTGIGISEDKQDDIFEAFQQEDGSTSRDFGGTGLGLSIVNKIIDKMNGFIVLESVKSEGSTFKVILPKKNKIEEETSTKKIEETPAEKIEETTTEKVIDKKPENSSEEIQESQPKEDIQDEKQSEEEEKIVDDRNDIKEDDKVLLLIENDSKFTKILIDKAKEKEFKVIIANNGKVGLKYAKHFKPNGIILDLRNSDMKNEIVLEKLKNSNLTRHIPVHVNSEDENKMDILKRGAVGFFKNPVNMNQMDEIFQRLNDVNSKKIKKLLIIEDNKNALTSIAEFVKSDGIEIIGKENGKDALERLKEDDIDCVILDLGLPDMAGKDILEKIKTEKEINRLPVIVYTGKELLPAEKAVIDEYSESLIIKGEKSADKLLSDVSLFLHKVESKLPESQQKIMEKLHNKSDVFKGKTILLVDDDMRNIFALSAKLEDENLKVIIAKNGKIAVEQLIENTDIDLVLMDIMMPVMDGYEAIRKIRDVNSKVENHQIPIIALTAKAMKGDRNKCIEAGANDYISKPINTDKLFSLMRLWLY